MRQGEIFYRQSLSGYVERGRSLVRARTTDNRGMSGVVMIALPMMVALLMMIALMVMNDTLHRATFSF